MTRIKAKLHWNEMHLCGCAWKVNSANVYISNRSVQTWNLRCKKFNMHRLFSLKSNIPKFHVINVNKIYGRNFNGHEFSISFRLMHSRSWLLILRFHTYSVWKYNILIEIKNAMPFTCTWSHTHLHVEKQLCAVVRVEYIEWEIYIYINLFQKVNFKRYMCSRTLCIIPISNHVFFSSFIFYF